MRHRRKRSFRAVGTSLTFIALLVAIGVVLFASGATSYRLYVVEGGSMRHDIRPGTAVLIHKGRFQEGQDIVFTVDGFTDTHRLMDIQDGLITTRGTTNGSNDPGHPPVSAIVGGVVAQSYPLGWTINFLRRPTGWLVAALLVVSVLLASLAFRKPRISASVPAKTSSL